MEPVQRIDTDLVVRVVKNTDCNEVWFELQFRDIRRIEFSNRRVNFDISDNDGSLEHILLTLHGDVVDFQIYYEQVGSEDIHMDMLTGFELATAQFTYLAATNTIVLTYDIYEDV